jgi:hypothetical protein
VESSCEFGIERSGSMKCWETIEWPNILWPLEYAFSSEHHLVTSIVFAYVFVM